ncbi:JAB domain-containing protein [Solibacillus sp. FSL W7-1436]|uniref:JAB domain-containing protein n=1 Tax=Solibacillus sp. FSL W7-1436 TaxID=2921705 RepID=UPI0030FB50FE
MNTLQTANQTETETILEVVSLHQKVKKLPKKLQAFQTTIKSPDDVAAVGKLAIELIGDYDREVFLVIGVSTKNQISVINKCHVGTVNASLVSPREIMKPLIMHNCTSYFIFHNHPSFVLVPSPEDLAITERMAKVGEIMAIELIDSLIVSDSKYISLKEKGYL